MSLYVHESGPVSAPTIVLLHEAGFSSWMWNPQIADLSRDYHLLVPDLPEHGYCLDIRPFTIQDSASRVCDLIQNRAHGERATVVGIAVGGQITLELMCQAGGAIDHVIVSGVMVKPMSHGWIANLAISLFWPFKNSQRLIRWNLQANCIPNRYLNEFAADTRLLTRDRYQRVNSATSSFRLPSEINCVRVPTLVLIGSSEYRIKLGSAKDLLSCMPNARGYVVTNAMPFWNLQMPDLFNQTVRAWINHSDLPQELMAIV